MRVRRPRRSLAMQISFYPPCGASGVRVALAQFDGSRSERFPPVTLLRSLCLAAAVALAAFASPAAAQLSPAEQAMIGAVDSEHDRTVAMLGRWVEQNSGTMNF